MGSLRIKCTRNSLQLKQPDMIETDSGALSFEFLFLFSQPGGQIKLAFNVCTNRKKVCARHAKRAPLPFHLNR